MKAILYPEVDNEKKNQNDKSQIRGRICHETREEKRDMRCDGVILKIMRNTIHVWGGRENDEWMNESL